LFEGPKCQSDSHFGSVPGSSIFLSKVSRPVSFALGTMAWCVALPQGPKFRPGILQLRYSSPRRKILNQGMISMRCIPLLQMDGSLFRANELPKFGDGAI